MPRIKAHPDYFTRALREGQTGETNGGFFFRCEKVFNDGIPNRKFLIAIFPDKHNQALKIMATLDRLGRYFHHGGPDDYGVNLGVS